VAILREVPYYKNFLVVHKHKITSFKMCCLKYILKYKIYIKFCDKFKSVRNVLCNYYVVCHHPEIKKNVCMMVLMYW